MSLQKELGLKKPFTNVAHEAVLNIVLTGSMLVKEGYHILKPFGLTDTQFNVLMLLNEQTAGGKISQTRLGDMMLVNRSNITGIIDRMEQSGLVRRTANSDDRRVNDIELTDAGKELLKKAHDAYYKRIEEVMSVLSGPENSQLCTSLEAIREQVRTRTAEKESSQSIGQ